MSNMNDFVIKNGMLIKYVGPGGDVIVPDNVTEIGMKAFVSGGYQFSSAITTIQLSRSINAIRLGAFSGCTNLRSITMHPGVTIDRDYSGRKVGSETVGDCRSMKEIVFAEDCDNTILDQFWEYFVVKIPNNTESAMKAATLYSLLKYCPDYVLNDPEKAKKIKSGKKLLADMAIERDDAETMGKAFSLHKNIKLDELNGYLEKAENAVTVKAYLLDYKEKQYSPKAQAKHEAVQSEKQMGIRKMTVADWKKVYRFKKEAGGIRIDDYIGADLEVVVPDQIGKDRVIAIGSQAFSLYDEDYQLRENRRDLISVVLPEGITSIGYRAFEECPNLTSVTLPGSLTKIDYWAFNECKKLTAIHIPAGTVKIERNSFKNCENLTIHAPTGSYAETYAKENNIPFVAE